MKKEVLSSKTLIKGKINKIEVYKYYDLHGQEISEGTEKINYDELVDFEIVEVKEKWIFDHSEPSIFDMWKININGEKSLNEYEITGYKLVDKKLLLHGCVGAG